MQILLLLLLACKRDPEPSPETPEVSEGDGVFAEGCPPAGRAVARVIDVDAKLPGEAAVGTRGDLLLANERAAFVITDAVGQSTYWYYGGALADAVPMDGCVAGEDKLDDLGFVLAQIDLGTVENSIVRGFRADTVEVLADGSDGGPAIVRARGTDDTHWLVEHTLINERADDGGRPFSGPFGTEITVDYVLAPGSAVLEVEITVTNVSDGDLALVGAALFSYGDTLKQYVYSGESISLAGFSFDAGLPWSVATDEAGAYAWGAPEASLARMEIAGVVILADVSELSSPAFAISPGESTVSTRFFAVGDAGGSSAVGPLLEANPVPIADAPATAGRVTGRLVDASGDGVAGSVLLEGAAPGAGWDVLDRVPTDTDGRFELVVPDFEVPWDWRLIATDTARDDTDPVDVRIGDDVEITVHPSGALAFDLTDEVGAPSPARLHLVRDDGRTETRWIHGEGTLDLPPGAWTVTATRGFEYAPWRGEVTVPEDGQGALTATLPLVVDTAGWMSVDTHVHTSDSTDSDIDPLDQLEHAAAHGLEVVVHTDHENIVDRRALAGAEGLEGWVYSVIGEEVTSVAIEHMTMFPAEPTADPRGDYVEWYGLDIDELFGAMRERSDGGINLINHPSYMDRIGWDPVAASPTLDDPTLLGLQPDAALWSWNLDGIEVMNGHASIWADGNARFEKWMSMVNAGHRAVGVGCSDDHGGWETGFPRSYFASPTDATSAVTDADVVDAFRAGAVQLSAGGFARVEIAGAGPGGQVTDTDGQVSLEVHLEALPEVDVTHFVVFVNCEQVDAVLATDPAGVEKYDGTLDVEVIGDGQVVVAAFGTTRLPAGLPSYDATKLPRVMTNPIYVDGDGDGAFTAPGGRACTYDLDVGVAE